MNNISSLLCALLVLALLTITETSHESAIEGIWEFSVNDVPWEYSTGSLIFQTDENRELTGKVEFTTGRVIQISDIKFDGEKVSFEVNVDGNIVKTDFTLSDDELNGYVQTMDGDVYFSAKRAAAVAE